MDKPKAHVINLLHRPERWARCQKLWSPYFELVRIRAFDTSARGGVVGCKISHIRAAKEALKHDAMAIVLEDDAEPTAYFDKYGLRCISEARSNIDAWDMINCGPYLNLSILGRAPTLLERTSLPLLLSASYFQQTHFMLYNKRSVDFLEASLESKLPLDMFLGRADCRKLVPIRLLAKQGNWPSDIRQPPFDTSNLYDLSEKMLAATIPEDSLPSLAAESRQPTPPAPEA